MVAVPVGLGERVQGVLEEQIAAGQQVGVQAAAYLHGEKILDVAAGKMGADDDRPVRSDTLFNCFSTTKGVAALAVHMLADRGLLHYDAPVTKYWPEFGANGKEAVTVEQAMSHQAGLHATPRPLTADFVCDWQAGLDWVANGVPAWAPGTHSGYHALTYAWIAGGIVERAGGAHISDVVAQEIAAPLGVSSEMYFGIPDGVEDRLATLIEPQTPGALGFPIPDDHDFFKAMPPDTEFSFNDMRVRRACIPSANGHFSARALARMYGALANGGEIDRARIVSPGRIAEMQRIVTAAPDPVLLGMPLRKGVGFMMGGITETPYGKAQSAYGPRETSFGHSGAGGSTAFADPEMGFAMAVTINQMQMSLQAEGPTFAICEFVRRELGFA